MTGRLSLPNEASAVTVVGMRLYASGIVRGTGASANLYGMGCWDLSTRTECADRPFITFPHPTGFGAAGSTTGDYPTFAQGPYLIGGKAYTWTSHQQVWCVDMTTWTKCGGAYPRDMRNDATFPRIFRNGSGGGHVLGDRLYFAWGFGLSQEVGVNLTGVSISCFDTTTAAPCAGWDDGTGGPDARTSPPTTQQIWDLFFRYTAAGVPDAVCQAPSRGMGGCNSLTDGTILGEPGSTRGIPTPLYDRIHTAGIFQAGMNSYADHPTLPRSYFSTFPGDGEVCWDWSTNDFCTTTLNSAGDLNFVDTAPGDGYVGDLGLIRPGPGIQTDDYGARFDVRTGCWWSVGDKNLLWNFDDQGNVPCQPSVVDKTGTTTFSPSFCRSGVPADIGWSRSAVTSFDPANWASFVVRITLPDGTVVGSYDAKAGTTALDLSGVDPPANQSLGYQIQAAVQPGRNPLGSSATTPVVSVEPTSNGDGSYTLTYTIKATNSGDTDLRSLQLRDNLSATFAGASSWRVNGLTSDDLAVSAARYDGSRDIDLLAGNDSLPVAATRSLRLAVTVAPGTNRGPYDNSATGVALSPDNNRLFDVSDSGTDANPTAVNAGAPGDTGGSDDPVPVNFPAAPTPTTTTTAGPTTTRPRPDGLDTRRPRHRRPRHRRPRHRRPRHRRIRRHPLSRAQATPRPTPSTRNRPVGLHGQAVSINANPWGSSGTPCGAGTACSRSPAPPSPPWSCWPEPCSSSARP